MSEDRPILGDDPFEGFGTEDGAGALPVDGTSPPVPAAGADPGPVFGIDIPGEAITGSSRKPLDEVLALVGRHGGPTPHGWHTHAPAQRCPREAAYEQTVPRESAGDGSPLAIGAVLHEMLATYYTAKMKGDPDAVWLESIGRMTEALSTNDFVETVAECNRLFAPYTQVKYAERDSFITGGAKVVAVEQLLERTFPWGEPYTARADLIVRLPDGYLIVDHKTTSAKTIDWSEGWITDPEMLGLEWCSWKYRPIVGYCINGIVRVKKQASGAPGPEFERLQFAANKALVRQWLRMMEFRSMQQRLVKLVGDVPNFEMCVRRYGRCRHFERCAHGMK